MEAQKRGEIASFEPDYFGGFVKVTYTSISIASDSISGQMVGDLQQAFVPIPHSSDTITPETDSTVYSPQIQIHPYSSSVYMSNLGAYDHIVGKLSASGQVMAYLDATADSSGWAYGYFSGSITQMVPGYVVSLKFYNSKGTWLRTLTTAIPRITFKSYDKTNAIVTGTASAGKTFRAIWEQHILDASGNTWLYSQKTGTVSSAGTWSVDFGTQKMRGNDFVEFDRTDNANFDYSSYFWIPALECELGSDWCELYNIPNTAVTMSITHAGVTHTFSGKTNNWGYFYAQLVDSNQDPILLVAGDTVSGTGATTYKLDKLTAVVHPSTQKITGTAPANTYFSVQLYWSGSNYWNYNWTHANASGNFSADFTSAGMPATGMFHTEVYHMNKSTGNVTVLEKVSVY